MASVVQICNQALTKIGALRITDLLDDTPSARLMSAIYEIKRDAELAAHPWTFAITRAEIPALATAPGFGWLREFTLPADCLRLVEVGEDYTFYASTTGPLYQREGNAILSDTESPLAIRYVQRVTNTGLFSPLFVEALACRLAAEAVEERTQNLSKREAAWKEYSRAIREAKRGNAIEQPPQQPAESSWVQAMTRG